jgi:hypothetical protein
VCPAEFELGCPMLKILPSGGGDYDQFPREPCRNSALGFYGHVSSLLLVPSTLLLAACLAPCSAPARCVFAGPLSLSRCGVARRPQQHTKTEGSGSFSWLFLTNYQQCVRLRLENNSKHRPHTGTDSEFAGLGSPLPRGVRQRKNSQ